MPTVKVQLAVLVRALGDELMLAEALLFPEAACLHRQTAQLRRMLGKRVRELIERVPAGQIYRRRMAELPELRRVEVEVPPIRQDVQRRGPVTLEFQYVQWRHATEGVIAAVPALGIEVLAEDDRQLSQLLVPEIRSALSRQKTAESLRALVMLDDVRQLHVRPMAVKAKLKTLKQAAREARSEGSEKSVFKQIADNLVCAPQMPVYERDDAVARLAGLLTARMPRSVLLVGHSGVGKSALVRELARRREQFSLGKTPLWSTSGSRLISGMSGFGMWQDRCQKLVREAAKTKAIVHLGNLIELIEVGKGGCNLQGMAATLRPSIERGDLLAIVECTPQQLALIEREDPQLLEAFVTFELTEPTAEQTHRILARVAEDAATRRLPKVSPTALDELERLHRRYATYSAAPGRPLRFLQNLLEDAPPERTLEPSAVVATFSQETGLPLFMLDDNVPLDLGATRQWFSQRVMGQPEPVHLVTDLLAAVKAGLSRGGKPIASLLFIGPTGVGKTEMAKALAEFLYQDPGRMIRFDMSEYSHPAAVERLIGGAYASQGLLTQKVRDQPFMVVLLDEFEKAHPAIFDVLLQVLGEGRLTDGAGRVADFTNSVLIMTSNLGAESFRSTAFGFSGETTAVTAQRHFERAVQTFLRPEMFNRLDRIVPFAPLDAGTISQIARRELARISNRDGLRLRDVRIEVSDDAVARLAEGGYEPRYGARPLKRTIERNLVAPLAERLCRYAGQQRIDCRVEVVDGELSLHAAAVPMSKPGDGDDSAGRQLERLVELRRKVQALARSGVVLRLRNEIERLKQAQRQRQRKRKRQRRPEKFVFTAEQRQLLGQEQLLERIDQLLADICRLEDSALEDVYAHRPPDLVLTSGLREELDLTLRNLLFELFTMQNELRGMLTLVLFSASQSWLLELSRAYEQICTAHHANVDRYWLTMHDPEQVQADANASHAPDTGDTRRPVMHLLHRKLEDDDKPARKVVDVYRPAPHAFHSPRGDVIGVALQFRSPYPAALLETETGRHELIREAGKPEACFVETHSGLLMQYAPPADCGRTGSFGELRYRRAFDLPKETCRDYATNLELRIRSHSIDEAVARATADYLQQRIWSLLD